MGLKFRGIGRAQGFSRIGQRTRIQPATPSARQELQQVVQVWLAGDWKQPSPQTAWGSPQTLKGLIMLWVPCCAVASLVGETL